LTNPQQEPIKIQLKGSFIVMIRVSKKRIPRLIKDENRLLGSWGNGWDL
jgi:hypothetical protein